MSWQYPSQEANETYRRGLLYPGTLVAGTRQDVLKVFFNTSISGLSYHTIITHRKAQRTIPI